jgi:hypothetical protein
MRQPLAQPLGRSSFASLAPAGAPPANATFFCDAGACYSYISKQLTSDHGKKLCGAMGGTQVQYNSLDEQQTVEGYFRWGSAAPACAGPATSCRLVPALPGGCTVCSRRLPLALQLHTAAASQHNASARAGAPPC